MPYTTVLCPHSTGRTAAIRPEIETKLNRAVFFPSLQTVPHNHHLVHREHEKEKAWIVSSRECKLTEM